MKVIRHTDRNFASTLQQLAAASILFDATVEARARAIVEAVQSRGDEAVCEFTERFDGAKVAAAQLSNRYITDRFLPDKAIDLIDEAAAKLRTEMESMPEELESLVRRLMQLEIEREALKKEKDEASRDRLGSLEKQIAEEHPAQEVYDPVYGARPLKRFLQRAIETPLPRQLISGEITDHTRVTIEFKKGELTFAATSIKGVKQPGKMPVYSSRT